MLKVNLLASVAYFLAGLFGKSEGTNWAVVPVRRAGSPNPVFNDPKFKDLPFRRLCGRSRLRGVRQPLRFSPPISRMVGDRNICFCRHSAGQPEYTAATWGDRLHVVHNAHVCCTPVRWVVGRSGRRYFDLLGEIVLEKPVIKIVFNVSQRTLAVCVSCLAYGLFGGHLPPPTCWAALFLVRILSSVISASSSFSQASISWSMPPL